MAVVTKIIVFLAIALVVASMVSGRPQDVAVAQEDNKRSDKQDLKTANSYGLGYGYGFGYPYGYYGLYGLGYGYPYYNYYGAYSYPFYG